METSFGEKFDSPFLLMNTDVFLKSLYILDNLRSAFNVGAIFRLCDAMRVSDFSRLYRISTTHQTSEDLTGNAYYVP